MISIKEIDDLFADPNKKSEHVERINKISRIRHEYENNHYKHPFYCLIRDRGKDEPIRWGCELHPLTQNIHFDTIIHHMMWFEPEKHKNYIINHLKQIQNVRTPTTTTTRSTSSI